PLPALALSSEPFELTRGRNLDRYCSADPRSLSGTSVRISDHGVRGNLVVVLGGTNTPRGTSRNIAHRHQRSPVFAQSCCADRSMAAAPAWRRATSRYFPGHKFQR